MIRFRFRGEDVASDVYAVSTDGLALEAWTPDGRLLLCPWEEILTPAGNAGLMLAVPRSGRWPKVRETHLAKFPSCAACGGTELLQVHHVRPYHLFPELELDPTNLLTLCERPGSNHHLEIGHGGNWSQYMPNAVELAWRRLNARKAAVKF